MEERTYPIMYSEVLEAIHLMFEDEPDIEADCYLYLSNINDSDLTTLKLASMLALKDMNRCIVCGSKMRTETYKEPHNEIGVGVYETLTETYCPVCDRGEYCE